MLNNSLFSAFLLKHGLRVYKGESTRDVVCLDFDFGSRSYEEEIRRLEKMLASAPTDEVRNSIQSVVEKVESRKDLYAPKSREEIRDLFYEEGVDITYQINPETIHYRMLYRTSAKAKIGQVIFIDERLYDLAYDWMTMGLGKRLPLNNAKIVEMSAYAPLTTSTIVDTLCIPVENILILEDQESSFRTVANIVKAEPYIRPNGQESKRCVVRQEEVGVTNTLWDGMGIIESSLLPLEDINGMVLLRNHMFKMCGFRGFIQKFFVEYCYNHGIDYETYQLQDTFGNWHLAKDVKIITTDNAIKWKKFIPLMGDDPYGYWCEKIREDGSVWGIVKTDHRSKLGQNQQMSYQMLNTLPCSASDVEDIAQTSIRFVELIKSDDGEFEKFLRENSNAVNHYEMMAELYDRNPDFADSTWFRYEKKKIISEYVRKLRTGKIFVNADNLTVCGNPYGLLLHAVGEDWREDPSFSSESGCVQCYTSRFRDGEYLAGFRNPHNAPNNVVLLKNVYSEIFDKYFPFSDNIIAVNCIGTDIQDRCNGMDFDSDFLFVTNQETVVKNAGICYREYPTIVNALKESGIVYQNTPLSYSEMDNRFARSKLGIGWSSNLAMLAMTYYWTEKEKIEPDKQLLSDLYDNFIILSVIAQVIIDGCKRGYEIDGMEEIERITNMLCMNRTILSNEKEIKRDFPLFMKYTREIPYMKGGKELPYEVVAKAKAKLRNRIDYDLVCPMNWLQEALDKIQIGSKTETTPTEKFFIKMSGRANDRQMTRIMKIISGYNTRVAQIKSSYVDDPSMYWLVLTEEAEAVVENLKKIKVRDAATINRLVEIALGLSREVGVSRKRKYDPRKYTRKIMNLLYLSNREKFLSCFTKG